jgi:hypothetical protein
MNLLPEELVRQIHAAPARLVLALNGGSRALPELLEVPGGSRTLLEATVPYGEGALTAWLGKRPEQFCSARTARAMAVVAFGRALRYHAAEAEVAGIACSASLASDRPKRGPHRIHVALQAAARTACWSLELSKGARSRAKEELVASRMVLNAAAEACGVAERLELPLIGKERVEVQQITAPPAWQDLFLGRVEAVGACKGDCKGGSGGNLAEKPPESETTNVPRAIFPGAFNPLHVGHRRMAEVAAEMLGHGVEFEISILNVDKPALDYLEIQQRLEQFPPEQPVWLTRAATFDEKARLLPGAIFIVGADTLRRIADPAYYGNDRVRLAQAVRRLAEKDCRFLVFGRATGATFLRLGDLGLPDNLQGLCCEVPPERFREDVSSTRLRKEE